MAADPNNLHYFEDNGMDRTPNRSISLLLSTLCVISLLLAGCGAEETMTIIRSDTSGSLTHFMQISITNDQLQESTGKVYVGIGSTLQISWATSEAPTTATVRLYLDGDGLLETEDDQIRITSEAGADESQKQFVFIPTNDDFSGRTGLDYYVIAQLIGSSNVVVAETVSAGVVHIGEGGVRITDPESDMTVVMGQQVTVRWEVTGDLCNRRQSLRKILRLYVDTFPEFRAARSEEMTPPGGINVCVGDPEFILRTDGLSQGAKYYIIARLFLEGNTEEESRAVSSGTIAIVGARLDVLQPTKNIVSNFADITVTWDVLDATVADKLVKITVVSAEGEGPMPISPGYAAKLGSGLADASRLSSGTYSIRCLLYELDASGREIQLGSANAAGKIIIPEGYHGHYDLADLAKADERGYIPVKGASFVGYNINDQVGFEVAGVGDIDGDGLTEMVLFSRYGQELTVGRAGAAYVIYGSKSGYPLTVDLNTIASSSLGNPVSGTILLFPMDNLPSMEGDRVVGTYQAVGLPDVSQDGKGDLFITASEARPLIFYYSNFSTEEDMEILDRYGLGFTVPKGPPFRTYVEPGHVLSWFRHEVGSPFDLPVRFEFWFRFDYLPGDHIHLEMWPVYDESGEEEESQVVTSYVVPAGEQRGTTYMVSSQRLNLYRNSWLDLAKIGNPVETDGLGGRAQGQMRTWFDPNIRFGTGVSAFPDLDGDGALEILISAPDAHATDAANDWSSRTKAGRVFIFGSEYSVTSLWNEQGAIAWGALDFPEITSIPTMVQIDDHERIEFHGAQPGSELTGVAGLGRFTDLTRFATYVRGDFNGDGTPDLVMGAPGENNDMGAVYIPFMRPIVGHRVALIDLADFNIEPPIGTDPNLEVPILGVKIDGTIAGERFGEIVKACGDFNDDGLADVMISMPQVNASGRVEAGRVFIVFGQEGVMGDFDLSDIDSHLGAKLPALIFEGQNYGDHLGTRVAAAYDVNGDGVDDILLAAPEGDAPGKNNCGKVYLIFGRRNIVKTNANGFKYVDYNGDGEPDEFWSVQSIGTTLPGAVFIGEAEDSRLQAVAGAGDVNGDGIGDFLMGAPFVDISDLQQNVGKAYVIFGSRNN